MFVTYPARCRLAIRIKQTTNFTWIMLMFLAFAIVLQVLFSFCELSSDNLLFNFRFLFFVFCRLFPRGILFVYLYFCYDLIFCYSSTRYKWMNRFPFLFEYTCRFCILEYYFDNTLFICLMNITGLFFISNFFINIFICFIFYIYIFSFIFWFTTKISISRSPPYYLLYQQTQNLMLAYFVNYICVIGKNTNPSKCWPKVFRW